MLHTLLAQSREKFVDFAILILTPNQNALRINGLFIVDIDAASHLLDFYRNSLGWIRKIRAGIESDGLIYSDWQ
jgi:hypothetical protein